MKKDDIPLRIGFVMLYTVFAFSFLLKQGEDIGWVSFLRGVFFLVFCFLIANHIFCINKAIRAGKETRLPVDSTYTSTSESPHYGQDDNSDGEIYVELECMSTDVKPTHGIANGSVAHEVDTGTIFLFDIRNMTWVSQKKAATEVSRN